MIGCGGPDLLLLMDREWNEVFSEEMSCERIFVSNDYVVRDGVAVISLMEKTI